MNMRIILVCALLAAPSFAEVISGPAKVLDKPYGKVLFVLDDGVKVTCAPRNNLYQRIGLAAVIHSDALWGHDRTKKHEPLYNRDGRRIGQTVRQVHLPLGQIPYRGGQRAAVFVGYVAWINIDTKSVVEHALESIVDNKMHPITVMDIRRHLARFGYVPGPSRDGFTTYICWESWVGTSKRAPRLALIFQKGRMVAILANREIHFMAYSPVFVKDGYTLTYLETIGRTAAETLEHGLVRSLLNY